MRQWGRRASSLHGELVELADVAHDPRWWLVAGGAALAWQTRATYVASDAEPAGDTFIGRRVGQPADPVADAIHRAHAARQALRDLDGALPGQPLAVAIRRSARGASTSATALDVAAFAVGERCWGARLAARIEDEAALVAALATVIAGGAAAPPLRSLDHAAPAFVTISVGDEPIETARHGHRRGWCRDTTAGTTLESGPWLGLGRAGGLAIVSTCHMVVDGYGHAWLASRIAELSADTPPALAATHPALPPLAVAAEVIPLVVSWRELAAPAPRALPLGYALGRVLHRIAANPAAPFSPTFQIPVAPGARDDPDRRRHRVIPAIASVRYTRAGPEPYETFEARTRARLVREASGDGLTTRLLAAARGIPVPLAWKRRAVGAARPRWLEPVANVIGGRGCVSRLQLTVPSPPSCAVSSPSRLASPADPFGSCVVTVIDDGTRAAITLCGSGHAASPSVLDELLGFLP